MDRELHIKRFKDALIGGDRFLIIKVNELEWHVESALLRISFVFDRYGGDSYMVLISDISSKAHGANIGILRHFRGAEDLLPDVKSPENYAEIFNKYFSDVLNGDFSILSEYEHAGKAFALGLMEVLSLPDDDPLKIKAKKFDISWLTDLKERKEKIT